MSQAKKSILTTRKKVLVGAVILAAIAAAVLIARLSDEETVTYTEATAEAVTMEQTLTAAGEVKAASSEEIEFSTSYTFEGMCVEEGDAVRKGQHLISYSNGTYTDAPDDGIITEINAPETGYVADEDNTLTLAYTDQMALEISVPEDEVTKVSEGDEARITINADTSKTFNGTITSVKAMSSSQMEELESSEESDEDEDSDDTSSAGSTDGASGSGGSMSGGNSSGGNSSGGSTDSDSTSYYTVDITLTNDGTLKAGMSGNCTITVSSRKSVLAVPVEAVLFDDEDNAYVNVIDGKDVTKTIVTTGESDANYVEITDGLSEGATVQIEVRR